MLLRKKISHQFISAAIPMLAATCSLGFVQQSTAITPQDGVSGSCNWSIDSNGKMVIKPDDGDTECTLGDSNGSSSMSYNPYRADITSVSFEGTVYANTKADSLFNGMTNVTEIDLANFDTSKTTTVRWLFQNARQLTSLDVSGLDTSKITDMQYMFSGCRNLARLDLGNFNTDNVTNMQGMFINTYKLTSINVSSFNTTNVTNMADMFNNAKELAVLDLSSFDTTNATNMNGFLNATSGLQKIILGANTDLKGSGVGRGLWRKGDGVLYRGTAINAGPGTFTKVSKLLDEMTIPYTVEYKINEIPTINTFSTTHPDIFTITDDNREIRFSVPLERDDTYEVPGKIELLFKDVVSDKYDNTYDLKMTVENIKLYDLNKLTVYPSKIYSKIVSLDGEIAGAIQLRGGIWSDSSFTTYASGHADVSRSYDISLSVVKDGNPVDGSYLFSAYDLDGASYRDRGSAYDNFEGKGYANFSEGINMNSGFDLSTVILSQSTILQKVGTNRYTGTKIDNSTENSEFIVKADASAANFVWTTGGEMNTTLFAYYQPRNIDISKKDQDGNFVSGASLEIHQGSTIVKSWQSSNAPELIWLNPGVYALVETAAPAGYDKHNGKIEFIFDSEYLKVDDKIVNSVVIINTKNPTQVIVPNTGVMTQAVSLVPASIIGAMSVSTLCFSLVIVSRKIKSIFTK